MECTLKELIGQYIYRDKEEERKSLGDMIRRKINEIGEQYVIAVDFDGTLCYSDYPRIISPRQDVIRSVAVLRKEFGVKFILWTCREEEHLEEAITWCRCFGLEFDAINNNIAERIAFWNNNSRKVSANEYWDDRAVTV